MFNLLNTTFEIYNFFLSLFVSLIISLSIPRNVCNSLDANSFYPLLNHQLVYFQFAPPPCHHL